MPIDRNANPAVGGLIDQVASHKPEAGVVLEGIYEKLLPDLSSQQGRIPGGPSWVNSSVLEGILETGKLLSSLTVFKSVLNRVSVQSLGCASLDTKLPAYTTSAKTVTLYSNHILAADMGNIRSIPNTKIVFHKIREGETKNWTGFTSPMRSNTDPDCWVGNGENIAVFGKPTQCRDPRSGVPKFVTDILPPVPLLPTNNLALNESFAKKMAEWTFIPKLGIKQEKLMTVLNNCGINFSRTLMTPMAFVDLGNDGWTQFYDMSHLATTKVKAIEIQKLRNDFTLVEITLAQYLENPQKYYIVLDIPKVITFLSKAYLGDPGRSIAGSGVAIQALTLLPTLIIHPAMLTTGSEVVAENLYLLLENLNKANLNNLIHRENYHQALETLKETTNHWDGILQVLAGADPADIRTALDELGDTTIRDADAYRKGNAGINKVYCSPDFTKWTEARAEVDKQATAVSTLTSSLANVQRSHRAKVKEVEQLQANIKNCENDIASLDTQGTKINANLQTAKNSTLQAEAKSRELYEKVGALAEAVDIDRFGKEVYIKSIGIAEHRGMNHEIFLAPRPGFSNVMCINEDKPTNPRHNCAERKFGDLVQLLQLHSPDSAEFVKALVQVLGLPQIKLNYVNLFTTKPVKIYVDWASKPREQCSVVVGGPYNITISEGTKMAGKLYLAGPDGIFGIKAVGHDYADLKQHPHSKEMKVNRKDPGQFVQFIKTPTVMCFGEAEAILKKAFTDKNLEEIRNVVYQWATSAWSRDQWGANWSWFPTPDRVSIEGKFNSTKEA